MNQKKNLLPIGFKDILTNDANIQFQYGKKLLKNFSLWGYSFIEPPIIEYEETLSDTKNKLLDKKTLSFIPSEARAKPKRSLGSWGGKGKKWIKKKERRRDGSTTFFAPP